MDHITKLLKIIKRANPEYDFVGSYNEFNMRGKKMYCISVVVSGYIDIETPYRIFNILNRLYEVYYVFDFYFFDNVNCNIKLSFKDRLLKYFKLKKYKTFNFILTPKVMLSKNVKPVDIELKQLQMLIKDGEWKPI